LQASWRYFTVAGQELAEFNPEQLSYTVQLPAGATQAPQIEAVATDAPYALVNISLPDVLPGTATITVTAEDGITQEVYTVDLNVKTNIDYTWYRFGYPNTPSFGSQYELAYENYNWGQVLGYPLLCGPIAGKTGDAPAAWAIWELKAPTGKAINSFNVVTIVQFEKPGELDGHVYVEWSSDPAGPWTRMYAHSWAVAWSSSTGQGAVTLQTPLTVVYLRLAADRVSAVGYWTNPGNLRFGAFEAKGTLTDLSSQHSVIAPADAPVSADGESSCEVEVTLRDFTGEIALDIPYLVTLSVDENLKLQSASQTLTQDGKARFRVSTASSSIDEVKGNVYAAVAGTSLAVQTELTFAGRLLVETDGVPAYSRFLEPQRRFTPGLPQERQPAADVPADGASGWQVTIQLVNKDGPVRNRKVAIAETEGALLAPEDFTPAFQLTDDNGQASFRVTMAGNLTDRQVVKVKLNVEGDSAYLAQELAFIPMTELALYVVSVNPAWDEQAFETISPVEVQFNLPIALREAESKLLLTAGGQTQSFVYAGAGDPLFTTAGNMLTLRTPRLGHRQNYTAALEGVYSDDNSQELDSFSWQFRAIDSRAPAVAVEGGLLAVSPLPWAVQVPLTTEVSALFTEDLLTGGDNLPAGLAILVEDAQGKRLQTEDLAYQPAESLDSFSRLTFQLSGLERDQTYSVTLQGAKDLAGLRMEPATWQFSTVTAETTLKVVKMLTEGNVYGEPLIQTAVAVYFNQFLAQNPAVQAELAAQQSQQTYQGTVEYLEQAGKTVGLKITLGFPLDYDTGYEVRLTGVSSEAGQSFAGIAGRFITEPRGSGLVEIAGAGEYSFALPHPSGRSVNLKLKTLSALGGSFELRNASVHRYEELVAGIYNQRLSLTDSIFELSGQKDGAALRGKLPEPVVLTIPYPDDGNGFAEDLAGNQVATSSLKIFRWDEAHGQWLPVGGEVNARYQTVSCAVEHFGLYALMASQEAAARDLLSETFLTVNPIRVEPGARGETTLRFYLKEEATVTVKLFDRNGRLVSVLVDRQPYAAGDSGVTFDGKALGRPLPRGLYVMQLYASSDQLSAFYNDVLGIW
jgi:hypothetical protein